MRSFDHTVLRRGPYLRNWLIYSHCNCCSWQAAGSKLALYIAEQAHICILQLDEPSGANRALILPAPRIAA